MVNQSFYQPWYSDPYILDVATGGTRLACIIACHPEPACWGALLTDVGTPGQQIEIARSLGFFRPADGGEVFSLEDQGLSREPLVIVPGEEGLELLAPAHVKVRTRSEIAQAAGVWPWEPLRSGFYLEMNSRIGLWCWPVSDEEWPQLRDSQETVGWCEASRQLRRDIVACSRAGHPVGLVGEWGSGKQYAAREIHRLSSAAEGAFVAVNPRAAAGLARHTDETAAVWLDRLLATDLLDRSAGGSLFLEDLAYLPGGHQMAIFERLPELGRHRRMMLGWDTDPSDTDHSWFQVVKQLDSCFAVPPLRTRRADIPGLVKAFVAERQDPSIEGDARPWLDQDWMNVWLHHPWPGNVSQLRTVVRSLGYSRRGETRLVAQPETQRLLDDPAGMAFANGEIE